jgi:O-antigen ligase
MQCARGLAGQDYPKFALQNFAFNFYIAFLFAGMWLGERFPDLLRKATWYLAWANGIYGILYLAVFGGMATVEELESGAVTTFGQPAGSAIALLGLLAFERTPRRLIPPLLLNACVLLGIQMRAEWLSFGVAIVVLSYLSGKLSRLFLSGAVLAGLLLIGLLFEFQMPAPTGRTGTISSRDIVGRIVASVDEEAAYRLTPNASQFAGTVEWRTEWWKNLYRLTHAHPVSMLFGQGYGFPIWEYNDVDQSVVPTPHNIFIYVLVYTGWVGVLVFYSLQFCLAWLLWKAYRASGEPFGFCLWILVFIWAHFDNKLETPFGAIPFYVLVGMALTSAMVAGRPSKSLTSSPFTAV